MAQKIIKWSNAMWKLEPGADQSHKEINPGLETKLEELIEEGYFIDCVIPVDTEGGYSYQIIKEALIIVHK